jgi:CBS-domain-containing membrane protein
MTKNCSTLPEVADVKDLLLLVKRHHYETFPIADYRGVLVGIVTLIDVIAALDNETEK